MGNNTGYIYLVESNGLFKVGKAISVEQRIRGLQTGSPYKVNLVCKFKSENYSEDERKIHKLLSEFSIRGEWFAIPAKKIESLDQWFFSSAPKATKNNQPELPMQRAGNVNDWIAQYKLEGGYQKFIRDMFDRNLYAFHFIRQDPEYIIEQAVIEQDDYTLFCLYNILVDKKFVVPPIESFEPRFIESIERFKSKSSWIASLSAAIHCFYS